MSHLACRSLPSLTPDSDPYRTPNQAPRLRGRRSPLSARGGAGLLALLACLLGLIGTGAAQTEFPSTSVNSPGSSVTPKLVSVAITTSGTIARIRTLSTGVDSKDYYDFGGGTCTVGTSVTTSSSCSVNVGFNPIGPGQRSGAVVLLDASNVVLGHTTLFGQGNGSLASFIPGVISTVAGNVKASSLGDGAPAIAASLSNPSGIAVDASGNLYIGDTGNNRIRKVATNGVITTIAGTGTAGYSPDGTLATAALISGPTGILVDGAGNVLFSDTNNNLVREINAFDGTISTLVGVVGQSGYGAGGLSPTLTTLTGPTGLAFDKFGNLYIADSGNGRIMKLDMGNTTGNGMSVVAGTPNHFYYGDGGPATLSNMVNPQGVFVTANGDIYIADTNDAVIRKIDAGTGIISTIAGSHGFGYNGDLQNAIYAELNFPSAVSADSAGNLFIVDTVNNRLRKIIGPVNTGSFIYTIGGMGTASSAGDAGPATSAGLSNPFAMAFDPQGNIYIADAGNNLIRKISNAQAFIGFPATRNGRVSAPITQVLENDGNVALNLASIQNTNQSQTNGSAAAALNPATNVNVPACANASSIAIFSQCNIGAIFAPTQDGNPDSGMITLTNDGVTSPSVITLSGIVTSTDAAKVVVATSGSPTAFGAPVTFTATVTDTSNASTVPTGTVTLFDGTTQIGAAGTLDANGTFAFPAVSNLTVGTHTITVNYGGDSTNSTASGMVSQVVSLDQAVVTVVPSVNPSAAGQPVTFVATVKTTGTGNTPTGMVSLFDGTNPLGSAGTLSGGSFSFPAISTLSVGTHSITAVYSGDTTDATATSAVVSQIVKANPSTLLLTTSANPSVSGQAVTFAVSVTSTGLTPTGTVTVTDGGTTIGTPGPVSASGLYTVTTSTLAVGTHTIIASYSGDSSNSAGTSSPLSQVVNGSSGTTTGITSNPPTFTLTTTPSTLTLVSGQNMGVQVTLVDSSTFADTISLGCAGLPQYATCSFTQDQVVMTAGKTTSVTLNIDTGNPLGLLVQNSRPLDRPSRTSLALLLPAGLFAFVFGGFSANRRRFRRSASLVSVLLAMVSLLALSGCGSGFAKLFTPPGTYNFQVVASGNTTGAKQSNTILLTVK